LAGKRSVTSWAAPQPMFTPIIVPKTSCSWPRWPRVNHHRRQETGSVGIGLAGVAWSAKRIVRGRVSRCGRATRFSRRFTVSPSRSISMAGTFGSETQSRSLSAAKQMPRSGPPTNT